MHIKHIASASGDVVSYTH